MYLGVVLFARAMVFYAVGSVIIRPFFRKRVCGRGFVLKKEIIFEQFISEKEINVYWLILRKSILCVV